MSSGGRKLLVAEPEIIPSRVHDHAAVVDLDNGPHAVLLAVAFLLPPSTEGEHQNAEEDRPDYLKAQSISKFINCITDVD